MSQENNIPAPPVVAEPVVDNFGFVVPPVVNTPVAPSIEQTVKDIPPPPPVNTGYEIAPEVPPAPPVVEPVKVDTPVEPEIVVDFGNINDDDKKSLSEYFDKHKLSKEAREGLVELKKNEYAKQLNLKQEIEKETVKIKAQWYNELKSDKEFGTNFDYNVLAVNKFMDNFLPGVKKMLTDKGGMLPPTIMKDYFNLAKKLNETEKVVQGDPVINESQSTGKYDFLNEYYKTN